MSAPGWGERRANLLKVVRVICGFVIPSLLTVGLVSGVCLAQASSSSNSSTATGAPTPSTAKTTLPPDQRVVLKVGDRKITQAEFERYIGDLEEQQGPATLSREQLGKDYADLLMLSHLAVEDHLDTSPKVLRQLAIDRTQILSNAEFAKLKAEAKPTPQQISAYYNAHLDDYDIVTLRRVFIFKRGPDRPKGVDPAEAKPLAEKIRQAYATGADPKKLIQDPETVVLDDKPITFPRGEMPEYMEKVAFSMQKPGEWKELANDPGALVLLQLVSRSRMSLSEMTPRIEKKPTNEKLREELDALKKKSGIWMDEEYFASQKPISVPSATPESSGQGKSTNERGEQ